MTILDRRERHMQISEAVQDHTRVYARSMAAMDAVEKMLR
jgi:hypothetical protein